MPATITKISGPAAVSGLGHMAVYKVLLDNSFAAGGEAIDLTADFSYIDNADAEAVDANADHGYSFGVIIPSDGTAVSSSNVLISAYQSDTLEGALDEANAVDLSGVGELRVTVIGKAAIPTSWA